MDREAERIQSIPEPLVGSPDETGQVTLDVFDVVQLGSERVGNVDDNDLPVCFTLIEESHDAEDLDLFDLASVTDLFTDLANVEGIIVTLGLGFRMRVVGVLPGLEGHRYFTEDEGDHAGCDEPEGMHRSSRCSRDGGSNCERNASDPS